jgi:hypothetical protein
MAANWAAQRRKPASACVIHETQIGAIAGAAPKAYPGAYKVLGATVEWRSIK